MTTATATAPPQFDLRQYKSLENDALAARIQAVRVSLGSKLLVLGHHYQQDEVIDLVDLSGDSYQLSQTAADSTECRHIAFCGVHFMAETADILANRPEKLAERDGERVRVILPDLAAGCSMADMAAIEQIEDAWDQLGEVLDADDITPVTYINSAASLKAFVGRHGGIVCTSSNAKAALDWALARTSRVMFFPDQHLGRNTALGMGITEQQMPRWDPYADDLGGNDEGALARGKVILWKGHCSVHMMFKPEHVAMLREVVLVGAVEVEEDVGLTQQVSPAGLLFGGARERATDVIGGIARRRHEVRLVEDGEPFVDPADGLGVLRLQVTGDEDVVRGWIDGHIGVMGCDAVERRKILLRTAYCVIKAPLRSTKYALHMGSVRDGTGRRLSPCLQVWFILWKRRKRKSPCRCPRRGLRRGG